MIRSMSGRDFTDVTRRLQAEADRRQAPRTDQAGPSRLIGAIQSSIDAISRGDFESVLARANDDVTLDIFAPLEFAFISHTRGLPDLRRALEHNFGSVEGQSPVVTQLFTEGDTVVMFGHEHGC